MYVIKQKSEIVAFPIYTIYYLYMQVKWQWKDGITVWKVSKYGVISGQYFPAFGLNKEIYGVNFRIQS